MAPVLSRAVLFDRTPNPCRRRPPSPVIACPSAAAAAAIAALTAYFQTRPATALAMCCGGHHHHHHCDGCRCACATCACRPTLVGDASNRDVYPRPLGRPVPSPAEARPEPLQRCISPLSAAGSDDGTAHGCDSFSSSVEAHDRLVAHHTRHGGGGGAADDGSDTDDEAEHPFRKFLSTPPPEDSSGMILSDVMDDCSLFAEPGGPSTGDLSLLSIHYEPAFAPQTATASDLLKGIGAAFPPVLIDRVLPLAPECRHTRTRQMCRQCVHY